MKNLLGKNVTGVTDNSNKIEKGNMFVCIKGEHFDGHSVAAEVLEKGAEVVVTERDLGLGERQIIVEDTRKVYGELCSEWFGNPQKELKIIGVTGTNGKTTLTNIIKHCLTYCGYKVGLIGTIQNEIGDEIIHAENTTPFAFDLMKLMREMVDKGCKYLVMEVSSFGLVQKRIGNLKFDIAVFTNLTQDHLDYHGNMENYYQAKKLLFDKNISENQIINIDDEYGKRLYNETECFFKYSYSVKEKTADYYAYDIKLKPNGNEFYYNYFNNGDWQIASVDTEITGMFNVSNVVAALSVLECLSEANDNVPDLLRIFQAIEKYKGTAGRCEIIHSGAFTVMRDYAHTPDALKNILASIKEYCKGRLICLVGCGGNRDSRKRPLMGAVAAETADVLIITSDNPRDENPEKIIDEIITGVNTPYHKIVDRKEAIHYALKIARKDDIILLAGKGHEDYQIFENGRTIHFDEKEIVEEYFA